VKRIYVIHDMAQAFGVRATEFATRAEAEDKRDEWNEEFPGHRVLEIEDASLDRPAASAGTVGGVVRP
jgi:hypothetical protein